MTPPSHSEARLTTRRFAEWIAALDLPDSDLRRTITLTKIIDAAKEALASPKEPTPDLSDERGHVLSIVSQRGRPGEWVECSCGWATPDIQFPTPAEAIEWARKEHLR